MTTDRHRIGVEPRKTVIIQAAVRIARDKGLVAVTHGAVADRCVIATSQRTVRQYFPVKADLWRTVLDETGDAQLREQARVLGFEG